jgi:hypothetical protein
MHVLLSIRWVIETLELCFWKTRLNVDTPHRYARSGGGAATARSKFRFVQPEGNVCCVERSLLQA